MRLFVAPEGPALRVGTEQEGFGQRTSNSGSMAETVGRWVAELRERFGRARRTDSAVSARAAAENSPSWISRVALAVLA